MRGFICPDLQFIVSSSLRNTNSRLRPHEICRTPLNTRTLPQHCNALFLNKHIFHLPNLRRTSRSSICETVSAIMFYFYFDLRFTDDEFAPRPTYIRLKMDDKVTTFVHSQSSTVKVAVKLSYLRSSNLKGK